MCHGNKVRVPSELEIENVRLKQLIKKFLFAVQFKCRLQCSIIRSLYTEPVSKRIFTSRRRLKVADSS